MRAAHLLLSLHDVTPFHLERLVKVECFLASAGVTRVTYLVVPRFHGGWAVEEHQRFLAWCRAPRAFDVEWFLHGYFHSEQIEPARGRRPPGLGTWFKARFMTAGEGEFLALRGDRLRSRVVRGMDAFRSCFGRAPAGFVAPAWLFNEELLPVLRNLGLRITEDRGAVYDVQAGRRVPCPVIAWATRTPARKHLSRLAAPLLLQRWAHAPAIRIAIHPADFDHAGTIGSIERVLTEARRDREFAFYGVLDDGSLEPGRANAMSRRRAPARGRR